jgi:hypothetical protein
MIRIKHLSAEQYLLPSSAVSRINQYDERAGAVKMLLCAKIGLQDQTKFELEKQGVLF